MDEGKPRSPSPTTGGRFFGYPDEVLAGTWRIQELCAFLRVSERKAGDLMKAPGAPAPLRLESERCVRWNPYEVLAWLHGSPDAASTTAGRRLSAVPDAPFGDVPDAPPSAVPDAPVGEGPDAPRGPVPGRPWRPGGAR